MQHTTYLVITDWGRLFNLRPRTRTERRAWIHPAPPPPFDPSPRLVKVSPTRRPTGTAARVILH